uniref:Uncharacterized protein n=1 Tax=Geospiza parvula TaxID=87175 RepID=A0A8C3QDI7_GEOPR
FAWCAQLANRGLVSHCTYHHIVMFLLTFFSYSLLHASRKTFSNVKVSISSQWTPSCLNSTAPNHFFPNAEKATLFLGTVDTVFLFSCAVGLFVRGIVVFAVLGHKKAWFVAISDLLWSKQEGVPCVCVPHCYKTLRSCLDVQGVFAQMDISAAN